MYKIVSLFFLISFAVSSHAGWSAQGEVTRVISHDSAHVLRTTVSDDPCGDSGDFWWLADDLDAKDMLSIALSAFMSGKKIRVVYSDSNPDCQYGGSAKVTHLSIEN